MSGKNRTVAIYLPVLLAVTFAAGLYMGSNYQFSGTSSSRFNKLNEIVNYIEHEYVDSVKRDQLVDQTIQHILQELDPHSYYITAKELQALNEPLEGNFEGIGIQFSLQKDTVVVISPIAGGPSEKVGLLPGDRIVAVDGKNIAGIGLVNNKVMELLRGSEGTEVGVTVQRAGMKDGVDFTIVRDKIPIYSVDISYQIAPETGYIKVSRFSRTTHEEFVAAASDLVEGGITKLILDLRGNGGGYLDAATNMVDEFLKDGQLIVYTEGRARPRETYYATSEGELEDIEVVVLIDEGSASASEIVAGALQDNDRGTVMGRRSFGKGLVQEQSGWPDGSATRLTIARYYTPTGRCIQKPYDNGSQQYHQDQLDRLRERGDSTVNQDSIPFETPGGKIVFGGGGIAPDVYIPSDTSGASFYLSELMFRGLINQFAFEYVDKHRQTLNDLGGFNAFDRSFSVDTELMEEFVAYAEGRGTNRNEKDLAISYDRIAARIKAFIARNVWNNNGFYPVLNAEDKTVQAALTLFNKKEGSSE